MNKNRHKIVFNRRRGILMAVAETAVGQGKSPGERSGGETGGGNGSLKTHSGCRLHLGTLAFSLLLGFGSALIVPAAAADIQSDPTAPRHQQPTVLKTGNGLPQVNIQTPTAHGVSVNQYSRFDVDTRGAILNNSHKSVSTRQAGWIQGNPFLARGEARIIVNQINSSDPSRLNGYIEIAGRRAEVVMANPAGIRVDGGGFINSAGATLTTGRPILADGRFDGLDIGSGRIDIGAQGLDARDADYTRILSRAAKIDGGIWGQDVQVIAAGGQTDAAGSVKTPSAAGNPPSAGGTPVFAIDTGALGGMYAGKITLIAADAGSGIRNAGKIYAGAGGVTLSADGTLANSGTVAAQDGGALSLNAGQTDNSGTLYAHGTSSIDSKSSLNNSGRILSTSENRIRSAHIGNSGQIDGGRLDIAAPVLANSGRISQSGSQNLTVDTARLANSGRIGLPESNNGNSGNSSGNNGGNNGNSGGGNNGGNGNSGNNRPPANNGNGGHTQVPAPADGRISVSGRLDNSGTIEAGGRTDLSVSSELANSGRLTLGSLKAEGDRFDNRQGDILAHSADIHSSHSDNRGGALAAGSLKLDGTRLDNRQGVIRSNTLSDIRLSDGLNNQQGEITTAGSLKLAAGDIASSGGSILAGQDLELTANRLDGSGTLAAGRDAALKLASDFDSSGDIEAGRTLSIESGGSIRNRHRLAGGAALDIRARHIDNRAEGKLVSGSNTRIGADTVDNRGLINSNGLTRIDAATALNNIGSGRIYGSRLALGGGSLNNREEASADGKNQAPVIAARERLDIGMRSISNTGSGFGRIENGQVQTGSVSSLISSEGEIHIGGRLNERHQAEGRAERLENRGARIEAAGGGQIAVQKLDNLNAGLRTEEYLADSRRQTAYTFAGEPERYIDGEDGNMSQYRTNLVFRFNEQGRQKSGSTERKFERSDVSAVRRYQYSLNRYRQRIVESRPGEILIGGDLKAEGGEWRNSDSKILIGGTLSGLSKDKIANHATQEQRRLEEVGISEHAAFERSHGHRGRHHVYWRGGYAYNNPSVSTHDFENQLSDILQNQGSLNPPAGHAAAADAATAAVAPQRIKSPDGSFSLPESSLYTVRPDRPGYLVETDPAYADYRTWLGSDYMLKALQTDPNRTHKRLGDGYYEQRLINEQIARLTGYRRLDGYPNDEAQFKALMDAGISFARAQQLTPGIALSPEQVARLTSDIVWLESQTVTLADGSSQSVLVPKVYVLARPGDLNSAGGLISADTLQLNAGRIDNRGTLAGRRIVDLAAGDISNSGRIQGRQTLLEAQNQITLQGGSIEAERLLSLKADNITLQSSTAQSGDLHNGRTTVDRVAGLYISGTEDGQGLLSLEAGHDIKLNGARLANRARDGHTQVVSRQGSVTLGTVRTESHESYGSLSDKNHRHVHQSAEAGSRIEALGNITVSAGKDLSIRQGQIDSQNGRTTLAAQGNIDITEGRRTLDLDESTYSKERGLVGSKSRLDQYRRQHDEAAGSVMTGREVRTASGGDTRIRGSQVISDDQTLITAAGEVRVDAAENRYQDWENHERKKSGLTGSGGIGFFIGNKTQAQESDGTAVSASGSTVGSLKGDTLIAAKRYSQTGSIVSSPEGNVLVEAEKIDIQAADERYRQTQRTRFEQKGLTVAVNIPVVDAAIGLANAAKSAKQIHGSNSRVNLMAAANAARQGFNAGKTLASVAQNPQSAGQGISVSITYGEQKNTSETQTAGNRAQAARMEAGKAVILKAHGAGKDSDILIRGADIGGQQATYLSAENRVDIRSAEQQHQERSKNRQSGWNAGVALAFNNGVSLGFTAGGNYGKGYGNGDEATHLHSHIGSRSGQTFVHSGGDTTLKGAQLIGKGVQLDAANLNIESVQDTATFRGKQENMSAQITVGYGFSAGGSYSRSKSSADHASVGEQSGIFAGEDGYQVNVKGHTDLKGALLTSAVEAEAQGKNSFRTATLSHSDIANHSSYSGSSLGVDGSVSVSGEQLGQEKRDWLSNVAEQNTVGKAIGYGKVKDNRNSITHSGINTRNLVITDDAGQQKATGMSAAQTAARLYTDINTDTAEVASGSLKNQFDKEAVQKELDRQREVTQEFDRTRQQVKQTIHGMVDDKRKKAESIRYGNIIDGKRGYNNKESLALDASADKWEKTAFYTDLALGAIYGIGNSNAMIYTGAAAAADPARRAITAPMQIWEVKCRQDGLYCSNRSYDGKKLRSTDGQKMVEIGEKRQIFDLNEIRPGEKSGVITVSNNGIFNPRDDALKNAVKQNGSHARSDGIYVVYNRPTGNPFSELLYAAYDKTNDLLGGRLPLSNAERANVLLYDYAKRNNYKVDLSNHSRGGMTASVALQYANRHGLTEIPIREARFYGSATHVQRYADNLQKNGYSYEENGKTYGSATYAATHHTDFVGRTPLLLLRSKYIVGGNKPTGGVEGKWFLYSHSSYFWDKPKERLIDEQGRFIDADGNLSDKPVKNPYLSNYIRIWEDGEVHNQASPNASAPILVKPTKKVKGIEYYETPH